MKQQSGTSARTTAGLDSATDAQVWQIASHQDPQAFGVIFDRHADAVHRYCARRSGSADAADDLVSIVFLEAWRLRGEVVLQRDSTLPWCSASLGIPSRIVLAPGCATKRRSTGCRAPRCRTTPTVS